MTNKNTEIVVQEHKPISFMDMIAQNVSNPDFDANKLHMLIDAQERVMKTQADIEFNEAITRINAKMPRIVKNKSVSYGKDGNTKEAFKYAPLEDIDKIVAPLLREEGVNVHYDTDILPTGGAIIFCTLSKGIFSRTSKLPMPLDASGGKNNTQAMGSTLMYGRRQTLCMALNIVVIGQDDDGMGRNISEEQAKEIDDYIARIKMDKEKFLKTLKVEDVKDIKTKYYNYAMNSLAAKELENIKKEKKNG